MRASTILSTLAPVAFLGMTPAARTETAHNPANDVRDTGFSRMPGVEARMMEGIRDDCAAQVIDRWEERPSVLELRADRPCEATPLYAIMH